jgi:hypothetical protein
MSSQAPESSPPEPRKAGPLRLKAVVLLPGLIGIGCLAYYFTIDGVVADSLVAAAVAAAGEEGQAEVEHVSFSIFGPKLTVRELRAWQNLPQGRRDVLHVGEAKVDVEFWPLFERRLVVNEISMTSVSVTPPKTTKEDKPEPDVPTDTSNPDLNEYLKQVRDLLESEDMNELIHWLEKLKEYTEQPKDAEEPKVVDDVQPDQPILDPGPAGRAWYVKRALVSERAKPRVIVKRAALDQLNVSFADADGKRFVSSVTDLLLSAEGVSSDPVAYGEAMKFVAQGNLDGDAERRVELGLTLRFDADQLVTLEQVDGAAGIRSLAIGKLVDPGVFGDTLREVRLSLVRYSSGHAGMADRTRMMISGLVQPPNFPSPAQASFALWFGGIAGDSALATFAPSGISIHVEDFPLAPVLAMAGGTPLPVESEGATVTFGTCDVHGSFGSPAAAFTWHDGIDVRVRLKVNGMRFAEEKGELAGLPGEFVMRGLNRVIDGMGGLDVIVGFQGSKDKIALSLDRPGLRNFVDAVVNALSLTAPELESLVDLPFTVSSNTRIALASVNADGSTRESALTIAGEVRHDLNDLRIAINLRDVRINPKAGHGQIAGLPAPDFCRAFNALMQSLGPAGLNLRTRVMDAQGVFSPALESPGTRGIIDAMVGATAYTGAEMNRNFNLPFELVPEAVAQASSVDAQGKARTLNGPGSDSHDLKDLTLQVLLKNGYAARKAGHEQILGIPADYFTYAWNRMQKANPNGFPVRLRVFDANGRFAPAIVGPSEKELVKQLGAAVGIDDFGKNFAQIAEKYASDFPAFQKGGIQAAKDIAGGKVPELPKELPKEIPKEIPKEAPKVPDVPKPKLPW